MFLYLALCLIIAFFVPYQTYLQWDIRLQLEWHHLLTPRSKLFSFRVYEIIKDGALGRKLHCSHFFRPPATEFSTVVIQLKQVLGKHNIIIKYKQMNYLIIS